MTHPKKDSYTMRSRRSTRITADGVWGGDTIDHVTRSTKKMMLINGGKIRRTCLVLGVLVPIFVTIFNTFQLTVIVKEQGNVRSGVGGNGFHPPAPGMFFETGNSRLIPKPMAMQRNGIPLETESAYSKYTARRLTERNAKQVATTKNKDCSCDNPKSSFECCRRRLFRTHKMGCVMTKDLFNAYDEQIKRVSEPHSYTYIKGIPKVDFRDVIVLRDVYDSIISGYLYHKDGRECTKTGAGEPLPPDQKGGKPYLQRWDEVLSFPLHPPKNGRSLCQYLEESKPMGGLRAYVDWVFRYYYSGPLSHWSLSQEFDFFKERITTICYEDLKSSQTDLKTIDRALQHFYGNSSIPGKDYPKWGSGKAGVKAVRPSASDAGGHATSVDEKTRRTLLQRIKKIDSKFYNGTIAWVHSMLPCQNAYNTMDYASMFTKKKGDDGGDEDEADEDEDDEATDDDDDDEDEDEEEEDTDNDGDGEDDEGDEENNDSDDDDKEEEGDKDEEDGEEGEEEGEDKEEDDGEEDNEDGEEGDEDDKDAEATE